MGCALWWEIQTPRDTLIATIGPSTCKLFQCIAHEVYHIHLESLGALERKASIGHGYHSHYNPIPVATITLPQSVMVLSRPWRLTEAGRPGDFSAKRFSIRPFMAKYGMGVCFGFHDFMGNPDVRTATSMNNHDLHDVAGVLNISLHSARNLAMEVDPGFGGVNANLPACIQRFEEMKRRKLIQETDDEEERLSRLNPPYWRW